MLTKNVFGHLELVSVRLEKPQPVFHKLVFLAHKARHLIENFFATLKQYRAIATRYDKRAKNFLGAIYLAATVIWLN